MAMPRTSPIRSLILLAGLGVAVWQSPHLVDLAVKLHHSQTAGLSPAPTLADSVDHAQLIAALRAAAGEQAAKRHAASERLLITPQGFSVALPDLLALAGDGPSGTVRPVSRRPGWEVVSSGAMEEPYDDEGSLIRVRGLSLTAGPEVALADPTAERGSDGGGADRAAVGSGDAAGSTDSAGTGLDIGPGIDLAYALGGEPRSAQRAPALRPGAFSPVGGSRGAAPAVTPVRSSGVASFSAAVERRPWRFKPLAIIGPPGSAPNSDASVADD